MNDSQLTALAQIRDFLTGTAGVAFAPAADDATRFRFIAQVLRRFGCPTLARLDKGLIRRYLAPHHRLFARQLTRLLRRHRQAGGLSQRYAAPKAGFRRHYTAAEVSLLAEVDALHGTLPGPATRVLQGPVPHQRRGLRHPVAVRGHD